mmetsp:Transcript_2800/g.2875  ORF Transcript_2800/g.2875 Transcript_2800/m.2875 type:complete len:176 (-) Transcript_2800:93-620(-)
MNLSKPKKNIARDFSDGVLLAEIIKLIYPTIVDLHNYPSSHSIKQKQQNWDTLNRKVLKKMLVHISGQEIKDVIECKPFAVEQVLAKVYNKIYGKEENHESIKFGEEFGKRQSLVNKNMSKEEMVKAAIKDKDNKISILNSTLEVLQMKLKNSEDENKKLEEKIQLYQLKLMNQK